MIRGSDILTGDNYGDNVPTPFGVKCDRGITVNLSHVVAVLDAPCGS